MLADSYHEQGGTREQGSLHHLWAPLIADCAQQDLVEKGGLPANCLHNVYLQEDAIPVLLRYAFVQQKAVLKPDKETGAVVRTTYACILVD